MKNRPLQLIGLVLAAAACCSSARADLSIIPTYASSITSDPNAATIENTIQTAINNIDGDIANNVTVNITFNEESTGLGNSSTFINTLTYSEYLNDLKTKQTLSAYDVTAIGTLPNTADNPANGSRTIQTSLPLLRALGESAAAPMDANIYFNNSLVDESLGTPTGGEYSLESVVAHEMDEVIGAGGDGSTLGGSPFNSNPAGTLDLFRYSSTGVRSYTSAAGPDPYFSINGGVTNLDYFNQSGVGDYSDWGNGITDAEYGNTPPQVQDAFGTPDSDPQLGASEMKSLDVIGWDLTPAGTLLENGPMPLTPEPGSVYLLLGGLIALGVHRRLRKSA